MADLTTDLLATAFDELAELTSKQEVLAALPSLLQRFGETCVSVWVMDGSELALISSVNLDASVGMRIDTTGVVGRAFRTREVMYVPDVTCDSSYLRLHGNLLNVRAEVAIPLKSRGEVVAVLNVEAPHEFSPSSLERLSVFASAVGGFISQVQARERESATAQFAQSLPLSGSAAQAYALAAEHLREQVGARSALFLTYRSGQLQREWPESPDETHNHSPPTEAWQDTRALHAFKLGEPQLGANDALIPVSGRHRARRALWVTGPADRAWNAQDVSLVRMIARLVGLELEQFDAEAHLSSLLSLQRELVNMPAEALYQPLLDEAVRLVPGAERGSLLVRVHDRFQYRALVGYDARDFADVSFVADAVRDVWYALGHDAWLQAIPRIVSRGSILVHAAGYLQRNLPQHDVLPSATEIQANLAVPILYGSEVYAVLNLDSVTDPDAFAADSVEAAQSFAVQAAVVLHTTVQRERTEEAARTDALTGLPNRRAFNEAFARALDAAGRRGQSVSLLVLDLDGFKLVNDRFGHAAGDEALVRVARALRGALRSEDEVFRWGGDEFAVLLPASGTQAAELVAERVAACVSSISSGELQLRASIGVTSSAGSTFDGAQLLLLADAAMYQAKAEGRPYVVHPS